MLHALLCLMPVAVLMVPLLARRYPGERLLMALRRPRRRRLAYARPTRQPTTARQMSAMVRGGLLIARSLAVRPPPASLATS